MEIFPIAHIHTPFKEKFGIPRQSGRVNTLGEIVFEKEYRNPDALRGIEQFSHLWLLFDFSLSHKTDWSATVRPPRLGGNTKVGVFATRSPFRPNSIGLSCVRLVDVRQSEYETTLIVEGADLLDGTPIYDIKPYVPSDCRADAKYGFAGEHDAHRLSVSNENVLSDVAPDTAKMILECIAQDPRPAYQEDERTYSLRYDKYDVHFKVTGAVATIINYDIIET